MAQPQGRKSKRQVAVAVKYDRGRMKAPQVTAKGRGAIAERLLEMARAHGIPVREDKLLVEALDQLEVGQAIPPELYQVVAEILLAVYRAEKGQGS